MRKRQLLMSSTATGLIALLATAAAQASVGEAQAAAPSSAPSSVQPQSDAAAAPADAVDPSTQGIGDIVVTANRRSENQQRVPITISAFQAEKLVSLGVKSTLDLPQLTPGLSFTRTLAGVGAFLRGVGTTNSGFTTEPPIATYIDGLYLPNSAAAAFSFNNIERIEVLKGPQGTLYGRNTTGGLIQAITRDPGSETSLDASASYGNYDTTQLNFYGSTPLTDTLAANFAATYTNQDNGWSRNVFLNTDQMKIHDVGLQGKLKWAPAPGTKITLRGFYDKSKTDQGDSATIYPGSLGVDGTAYLGQYKVASRRIPFVRLREYFISLKAEQDVGFATLTSITGYIDNRSPSNNIQNGIVGQPVAGRSAVNLDSLATSRSFSQELQLTSNPSDGPFQYIAGLFYYRDNTRVSAYVYGTCVGAVCAAAPLPTSTTGYANTRSYSAYGEGTYSFSPSTRLTLGLRYTRDNKTLTGIVVPLAGLPNTPAALPATTVLHPGDPFAGNPNGIDTDVTFSKLTYKAVLAQDLGDNVHAYASFNRGFKSGGYNTIVFTNPPSRPEVLDAFEIGVKSELFDRLARLNVSGFYYNYKDIQLRSTAPPALPGASILFNAASAHIKGIDADLLVAPAKGLQLNAGLEYLDATYASFPGGSCTSLRTPTATVLGGVVSVPCDLSGRRVPSAPKFSYTIGITYSIETGVGSFTLTANDGYKSRYFWESDNRIVQHAYHLINASLTWVTPEPRLSLQLFGKNLGGAYYYASGSEGTGGNDVYVPGAPRTYGVMARYHF